MSDHTDQNLSPARPDEGHPGELTNSEPSPMDSTQGGSSAESANSNGGHASPAPPPANVDAQPAVVVPSEISATAAPIVARHPHHVHRPEGILATIQSLVITISIAVFVITFIVQAFQIPSGSMEDTLLIGDYLLVDKMHFGPAGHFSGIMPYTRINRGDIVVFRYPVHPEEHFVKRVIGVPGDRIRLVRRRVFVNGVPQSEPYVVFKDNATDDYRDNFPGGSHFSPHITSKWYMQLGRLVEDGELIVPEGNYFVLGDNRDQSLDSRYWGFVPRESIIGRPLLIYFSYRLPESSDRLSSLAGASTGVNDSNGKLADVRDAFSRVFRNIRWDRVMRLIG